MSRDAFLARVRQAAHAGQMYRVPVKDIPSATGYVGFPGEICDAFADEVRGVGGEARIVATHVDARTLLNEWLDEFQPRSALCWRHATLDRCDLAATLAQRPIEAIDYGTLDALPAAERRQRILAADVGITSADWAIAETGSLVMRTGPGHERVASLLPPRHIAIVEQSQILPDLFDVFEQLDLAGLGNLPSNITLITGPSKTGDIELQLTTGVHGPGVWRVIIVRGA